MKAMRGRIALQKHFVRNYSSRRFSFAKLWECARVLTSFLLLWLRFVQLLLNRSLFMTNIA